MDTRSVVLGHLLRGGRPTRAIASTRSDSELPPCAPWPKVAKPGIVALDPPNVRYLPLEEATRRMKTVPLDCDSILTARSLGTCLGDA